MRQAADKSNIDQLSKADICMANICELNEKKKSKVSNSELRIKLSHQPYIWNHIFDCIYIYNQCNKTEKNESSVFGWTFPKTPNRKFEVNRN